MLKVALPATAMVALTETIGLYPAAALYIAFCMRWLGRHHWLLVLTLSLGIPLGSYFLFDKWFLIPMPKGWKAAWALPFKTQATSMGEAVMALARPALPELIDSPIIMGEHVSTVDLKTPEGVRPHTFHVATVRRRWPAGTTAAAASRARTARAV